MAVIKQKLQFGSRRPVRDFIGARTLEVITSPKRIKSYIIKDGSERRKLGLDGCAVLSEGPMLNDDQIALFRKCVLTPESYYDGNPIFRRLPPKPNFAFRVWSESRVLDVLVDLHNPGWEFHCGGEIYRDWNWVGGTLCGLAKELFPQFASASSTSLWKQGAIKALEDKTQ